MNWSGFFIVTLIVVCIVIYNWPQVKRHKRDKTAFLVLITIGWFLSIMLMNQPDLPGPTQLIDSIFKPFGDWMQAK